MDYTKFLQHITKLVVDAIVSALDPLFEDLKKSYQPLTPTQYMSRKEVCALLGINLSTLWSYTKQKKLVSYGIGNRVFYKRSEVEAAIVELKISKKC